MVGNRRAINIKEANNQAKICFERSVTLHMVLCSQIMRITVPFFVSCVSTHISTFCILQFLYMVTPQKSHQKHVTKNFTRFHNHFLVLIISRSIDILCH